MAATFEVRVTANRVPAILANLAREVTVAVEDTARRVQIEAANTGHVVTGAMDASVYVNGPRTSDYAAATADATTLRPEVAVLPEAPRPSGPGIAGVVAVAEPYAVLEEARPGHSWFYPSVARVAPSHAPRVAAAVRQAARG